MWLFLVFGLATIALVGVLAISLLAGVGLCFSKRLRPAGVFVLLVPSLSVLAAGVGSWGLASLVASVSAGESSVEAWERWQVLALWAWPVGFVVGGLTGGALGLLLAIHIVKRRRRPGGRSQAPGSHSSARADPLSNVHQAANSLPQ
jgi:hypothetical protein